MMMLTLAGCIGILTGLMLCRTGLGRRDGLRRAFSLRWSTELRSALSMLFWGLLLTALLTWLAVLDVDTFLALPLDGQTILGGALLGVCSALCGFTPTTAFAGLGCSKAAEALCVLAGLTLWHVLLG